MPDFDRRDFLKIVGLGAGGAATGCYRYSDLPEKLIPYVVQPEEITPGIAVHYASTCQECSVGCGLHVKTREGRPIKLEGNPEHPINRGALCALGQASIGRTYHPDRVRGPVRREGGTVSETTWDEATALLASKVKSAGKGTFVFGGSTGPTLDGLLERWIEAVGGGGRLVYEPLAQEHLRFAAEAVFGRSGEPVFDLSGTDYVLDFAADSLDTGLSPVEHQRQLAEARNAGSEEGLAAHLVSVGPRMSTTISSSDEWLPARPGSEGLLALGIARVALEARRGSGRPVGGDPELLARVLQPFDARSVAAKTDIPAGTIERIGREVARARRAVALPPGVGHVGRRATADAAAVLLLDAVIGAVGTTVSLPDAPEGRPQPASFEEVAAFVGRMKRGEVKLLILHGGNPVHTLPRSLGFAEALAKVPFVVATGSLHDETTEAAHLLLPDHTAMESWGDSAPRDGVRGIVQPTLRPLFDTQAFGDTLLQTARALDGAGDALPSGSFREVLEAAWADAGNWQENLSRGGVFAEAGARGAEVLPSAARLSFGEPELDGEGDFVLLAVPSPLLVDGRGANLPWLQETPDPVTKVAWESWVEISREKADELGITAGDVLALETPAGRVEVPAYPRGGIRNDTVALALGQGHTVGLYASHRNEGRPGEARGANVLDLLPPASDERGARAWLTTRVSVSPTGAHQRLPDTQHTDNKRRRQLGEALTVAELSSGTWNAGARAERLGRHGEPGHGGHGEPPGGDPGGGHGAEHGNGHGGHGEAHEILRPFAAADDAAADSSYRWGMSIDLDRCSGCSACVVACSIENNIPNVGEEGVLRSRQMSWLRIERFVGEGEQTLVTGRQPVADSERLGNTDVRNSPMLCQQCGAAPCEPVCPVFATYHNPDGLNGMIYNRCIGTRYCSNNCPYKVRRFNWFDYALENWPEPMRLMLNPDVTVRGQGVMEKCTFCVQRINDASQTAKDEGRLLRDDEVTPACAQTCPSQAIRFGNLRDSQGQLVQHVAEHGARSYHALHVLNTRPAVTYLAKVRRGDEESQA